MKFAGLAEWLCTSLPSWLRGFNSRTLLQKERAAFAKKYSMLAAELHSEREFAKRQENLNYKLKREYARRGATIDEQDKEIARLEKALRQKIRDCGHCKTCNEKLADEIYFNQHGGIVRK